MRKPTHLRTRLPLLALGMALLAGPAAAQDSRYGQYASQDKLEQFLGELRTLVDDAERARAADRRFISDLRDLMRRHDWPWRVELLRDDFRDGDYTRAPAWTVMEGEFRVDRYDGLHLIATAPAAGGGTAGGGSSGKDLAGALLGSLLEQVVRGKEDASQAPAPAGPGGRAAIRTDQPITNAFALRAELTARADRGRVLLGVYQGDPAGPGYQLAYYLGSRPALELHRVSGRGSAVIDSAAQPVSLGDGTRHVIQWTRDSAGTMLVSVDDREQLRTTDRALRDDFDGLALIGEGAELMLREIQVSGTDRAAR